MALAAGVPARGIAEMREKRADAGLRLRILKNQLGLSVLVGNRIVVLHRHRAEWLARFGVVLSDDGEQIIARIKNAKKQNRCHEQAFHVW